ncbi:MAG: phage holin family protein [Candidatus Nomurabacteria bacterium]|nr:phage holin family protein [Candidatus Nomurabacteria bacterium]
MRIIIHWILLSLAVFATTKIISGISVNPIWVVLIVGACLTLFNMFIKPIINILTLPINIITLGLFSLIVNGALFWYLGTMINGFTVSTFQAAFIGALLVSIINWVLKKVFHFDF